ncbi:MULTISPECIES: hypothetical protein [Legionella]|uniref:hypothetical protein n=1 Tax=Legionella TaxID=445 RepID=UPI00095A3379|nr:MULTISPECIES: hypothetical protein [Legionella]MBN9225794.1 hypothetical protein [Legionella steelei]OJW07775.1 MAG: hypothetical protein BGO44_14110 [Legionella sp. 39-23]
MPNAKELLLNVLNRKKTTLEGKIPPFQIECLDMFQKKIMAIQVDETAEMDLQICSVLLDKCFCDLDNVVPSESRIIGLINKANCTNDDFYTKVTEIFDSEIQRLNHSVKDTFYDQTFKYVKTILVDMKAELARLKVALAQQDLDITTSNNY